MVMDAVIRNWVTLVMGEEVGPEESGRAVQWLVVLFYTSKVLLASL